MRPNKSNIYQVNFSNRLDYITQCLEIEYPLVRIHSTIYRKPPSFCGGEATSFLEDISSCYILTRLKVLELAKLTLHAYDFSTVA